MDSSVSPNDEISFLRVCHNIWKAVYYEIILTYGFRRILNSLLAVTFCFPFYKIL